MKLSNSRPIFLQIMSWVEDNILKGEWNVGYQLPSVREMSAKFAVNNNTIVRTYEHLVLTGTIFSKKGIGYFVSPEAKESIMSQRRAQFFEETLPDFINQLQVLGISAQEIKTIIDIKLK